MLNNLNNMRKRLQLRGGEAQQDRMIYDKKETLDRALLYSYQGAKVKKLGEDQEWRALMNPDKLKQDYDDKIISINHEANFKPGDVFEWVNTNSYWLIYLQELTELAYFRGEVRKCKYVINWVDDGKNKSVYAAVRGPVETKINSSQKHGFSMDTPNYTLSILIPKNEDTIKQFKRYTKFFLEADSDSIEPVCWRVEAVDAYSTPGILEVAAIEYYVNKDEDDVENKIVGGLIKEPENPNGELVENIIVGETFIQPKQEYVYSFKGPNFSSWSYDKKLPLKVSSLANSEITIKWLSNYSGQFELKCGDYVKTIVVESLF